MSNKQFISNLVNNIDSLSALIISMLMLFKGNVESSLILFYISIVLKNINESRNKAKNKDTLND